MGTRDLLATMIIGESEPIQKLLRQVARLTERDPHGRTPILLQGESGTGKECFARAIHSVSARGQKPFVAVNCGAIPEGLIEDALFGHEKGAFTGAANQHKGSFERADDGTLFLDEIGELPLIAQVKLLRVLQEGEFERVGGSRPLTTGARIIAATNADLACAIREKRFREDLFYRVNVISLTVPPLRERRGDIPLLVTHIVCGCCAKMQCAPPAITQEAMEYLQTSHDWPGNVRELENILRRVLVLSEDATVITPQDIASALGIEAINQ